jgi:plastocyanin
VVWPGILQAEQPASSGASTGTIHGTVLYEADPLKPWRLGRYYIRNAKVGELAEAVVAISDRGLTDSEVSRSPATITIDQKNFQFIPETVAIRTDDQIRFLNSDDHVHNVKSAHPKLSFNINMPVGGEHVETFSKASGIRQPYQIECVYHASMRAWIFVFDHPWFALTGEDGSFELKNVPAGEYRLDVVHPAGNLHASEKVKIVAGKESKIQITLRPSQP